MPSEIVAGQMSGLVFAYFRACSHTKCTVVYMQLTSLGLSSIMGKNVIVDFLEVSHHIGQMSA